MLLHFNDIATVSAKWRAQNLFESLYFTLRYMYRLATEVHQNMRLNRARKVFGRIHGKRHGVKDES